MVVVVLLLMLLLFIRSTKVCPKMNSDGWGRCGFRSGPGVEGAADGESATAGRRARMGGDG